MNKDFCHDRMRFAAAAIVASLLIVGCQTVPKTILRASDIPVGAGTTYEAYQSDPAQETAPVEFDAKGPWDFTKGSTSVTIKSQIIDVDKAADHESFQVAKYAEKIFASDYTGGAVAYNFASLSESDLRAFGQSAILSGQKTVAKRFTKPERLLVFPLRVGDEWTDRMSIDEEAGNTYEVKKEVLARGVVKVPAGIFVDCFMVRITKITTTNDGTRSRTLIYAWWGPGVGLVAATGSRPGEEELFFKRAAYLFRLKSYTIK